MACGVIEVLPKCTQIVNWIAPEEGVDDGPNGKGDEDAANAFEEEGLCRLLQGEEEVTRGYNEERHARAGKGVEAAHPKGV